MSRTLRSLRAATMGAAIAGLVVAVPMSSGANAAPSTSTRSYTYSAPSTYSAPRYTAPAPAPRSSLGMTRPSPTQDTPSWGMRRPDQSASPAAAPAPAAGPSTTSGGMRRPDTSSGQSAGTPPAAHVDTPVAAAQPALAQPAAGPTTTSGGMHRPDMASPAQAATAPAAPPNAPKPGPFNQNATAAAGPTTTSGGMHRPDMAPSAPAPAIAAGTATAAVAGSGVVAPPAGYKPKGSAFDQAATREMTSKSIARAREETARAAQPPLPVTPQQVRSNPVYVVVGNRWKNTDDYWRDHDSYMRHYRSSWTPEVNHFSDSMHPNYGSWATPFLVGMVAGGVTEATVNWAFAHHSDPGYMQWHQDAIEQARNMHDEQMLARLNSLDAQVGQLQTQGATPQAQDVLPPGVDASVAIAPQAIMADAHPKKPHTSGIIKVLEWLVGIIVAFAAALLAYLWWRGKRSRSGN